MPLNKTIRKWIEYAQNDLLVAKNLIKEEDYVNRAVLVHCQQSIEKYLKAYMLLHDLGLKKTHDLQLLNNDCIQIDSRFSSFDDELNWLSSIYMKSRYPDDFEDYSKELALKGLDLAKRFEDFFFQIIAEEENS